MIRRIKVDNCAYCACVTSMTICKPLMVAIEDGDIGCANCEEVGDHHTEFDIFEDGKIIWCGHKIFGKNKDRNFCGYFTDSDLP